ncbi:hypothetical protein GCM10008022_22060 [Paenibacillus hunanensis]|nr:hypothetical protein GCM10008022_22060 [Paenibacillus hunanensis]
MYDASARVCINARCTIAIAIYTRVIYTSIRRTADIDHRATTMTIINNNYVFS